MTKDNEAKLIALWMSKAHDALASAELELHAGHTSFAVNRLYYACFYAVTALLQSEGKQFVRHSGVLSEFRRSFIKSGRLDTSWGRFYQTLFEDRQEGDYLPTKTFSREDISSRATKAIEFVRLVQELVET